MRKLTISTGRSRYDTRWKQREVSWEQITKKLSQTHRTTETEADYHIAPKDRKTEIKDIGGFVGGIVEGGKRKKGSVNCRSLITLDIDYGKQGVWDEIQMQYDCACCIYSTHSHTHNVPRLRWIIPLSRDVDPEEYEALARATANNIGIDMFDDSTYQAERLMFWPSTPKDGEYVYEEQIGDPLDVDAELRSSYRDWRDSSQWPVSSRQTDIIHKSAKMQGDPLQKSGIVGRFCRAYTIQEAIDTFLSDEYAPTANDPNRYTYLKGSTAGGLVIYEDKFAYSHHGTDPSGGQLCNAFDLVRIHLYGSEDEGSRKDTEITKRPSYKRMEELIQNDSQVSAIDAIEIQERLKEDYTDAMEIMETMEPSSNVPNQKQRQKKSKSEEKIDWSWTQLLDTDKNGNPKNTTFNILKILTNCHRLKDNIRRNDMTGRDEIIGDLPWRRISDGGETWNNDDDQRLQVFLDKRFGITGKDKILNAKTEVACMHRYHPVRDYLRSLRWDQTPRLETIFVDYLSAKDTPLTRAVSKKCFVAAVARVMHPGCKYDYITVLQGPEGIGKSTLLKTMGGQWFNDSITDLSGKEGMEQIQGCWIVEAAELQGVKRNEVEEVKAFVSRQVDTFRPAYGRTKEVRPRQCVFFSTTNEAEFLKGNTGNRRFWVIPCDTGATLDVWEMTDEMRDQLWAEAVHYFDNGEELFLDHDLERKMRKRQSDYNEINSDARIGMIEEYLNKMLPVEWGGMEASDRRVYLADTEQQEKRGINRHDRTCAVEILQECFGEKIDGQARYKVKEINSLLDKIRGWEKTPSGIRFPLYGYQRGYTRIDNSDLYDDEDL